MSQVLRCQGHDGGVDLSTKSAVPAHLLELAASRTTIIAALGAVTVIAMAGLTELLRPELSLLKRPVPYVANFLFFETILAGYILLQRFSPLSTCRLVDASNALQILGALSTAVFEHSLPLDPDTVVQGMSRVSLWIAFFGVLVPSAPARGAVIPLVAACMEPLGYFIASVVYNYPPPAWNQLVLFMLPTFLMAGWVIWLNRRLYRLEMAAWEARELGSYRLEAPIGQGGMGEVWSARHRLLARDAAVKLIRPEILMNQGSRQAEVARRRFEQEAHAIANLQSPHTIQLFDYGITEDGSFYYVMEMLNGLDLESLVKRFGPLPAERVIHILRQACNSLAEAHRRGLVHRDIKPTNIFVCHLGVDFDFVKILDFGLVRNFDAVDRSRMTLEGTATGTPAFMAPEIAEGAEDYDGRVDLYGLGCVAYWLLTGTLVFPEANPMATVVAHLQKTPEPPSSRTEIPIPAELEQIVLACLAKKPEDRPQSAEELDALLGELPQAARWGRETAANWWKAHLPSESAMIEAPALELAK